MKVALQWGLEFWGMMEMDVQLTPTFWEELGGGKPGKTNKNPRERRQVLERCGKKTWEKLSAGMITAGMISGAFPDFPDFPSGAFCFPNIPMSFLGFPKGERLIFPDLKLVVSTPLKNMKVSCSAYSHYMEKKMFQTTNQCW